MPGPRANPSRFLQFRLRTLFVLLTAVALWLGWQVRQAERQRRAVQAILDVGGIVEYDFESSAANGWRPAWVRRLIGNDLLHDVVSVQFDGARMMVELRRYDLPTKEQFALALSHLGDLPALERLELGIMLPLTDADLANVAALAELRELTIYAQQVTDAGLEHLASLRRLEQFHIDSASVTRAGIDRLQQALPACHVVCDDAPPTPLE